MEKKKNGGAREGAGRKPKADEEKATVIFLSALKRLYSTDSDDVAKVTFIEKTLMQSQRGQLFIAEHLFGKAPDQIESKISFDTTNLTDEEKITLFDLSLKMK